MVKPYPSRTSLPYKILLRDLGATGSNEIVGIGFMKKSKGVDHLDFDPPHYSLSVILSGRGRYEVGGKCFRLKEGSLFHRFPGVVHSNWVESESWEECFVDFGPSQCQAMISMGLISMDRPCGELPHDDNRVRRFLDLFHLYEKTPQDESTRLLPQTLALAESCLREMKNHLNKARSPMVQEAMAILGRSPSQRVSPEELCSIRGWKYETFRKAFRQQTGTSPHQYAIRHRMDEARLRLMANPSQVISELALELGYNNVYEFSRHFKQIVGVSPKHFRG